MCKETQGSPGREPEAHAPKRDFAEIPALRKAVIAGHICLDLTPALACSLPDLSPGKLVQVGTAAVHTGGAVANTGLAMRILGADVRLLGKIGRDRFGQIVKSICAQYGSEGGLIEDPTAGTSYTVVLAIPGVDRIFLHHPGANDDFYAADIPDRCFADADHFHFGYPPLMRGMYERGGEEVLTLFRRAKGMGLTTSLDMAAVDPKSPAGQVNWRALLQAALPLTDFFLPSVEELCHMLDPAQYAAWNERAKGNDITAGLSIEEDVRPLAEAALSMGAKAVLVKCGALGIYYQTAGGPVMAPLCAALGLAPREWSGLRGHEESFRVDHIASATGAGDVSIAAFLTAMLRGYGLAACVELAAAAGARCLSSYDALSALEPLDDLWQRIRNGWAKTGANR